LLEVDVNPESSPKLGAESGAPRTEAAPTVKQAAKLVTLIGPTRSWQLLNIRELWIFRELIYFLAWRDVKVRYKQTVLGAAWAVLQPALMMVVFSIVFGRMAKLPSGPGVQYPVFVLAGLLPWTFFSTAISSAANSVVGSERLITKIYFPRLAIPFASVAVALVDFLVACGLLALVMAYYHVAPTPQILLMPVILAIILLAALGLGTLLAALNVAYRDFRYVVPFLVQIGMFATPTIYMQPSGHEGRWIQTLLIANPMTGLIAGFRDCVLGGSIPWASVAAAAAVAVILFLSGCFYFRRVEDSFADII
jgi:lipopolysaccharide transport system permease protein